MSVTDYVEAINQIADDVSNISEAKGFWDMDDVGNLGIIALKLALIGDEVSEALKVHREEYDDSEEDSITRMTEMQEDDFAEEIADIIIRALDLSGYYNFDIGRILLAKVEKNKSRSFRHSKRY